MNCDFKIQIKKTKLTSNSCSEILYEAMSCSTKLSRRDPNPVRATDAPDTAEPCWQINSLLLVSRAPYLAWNPKFSCLWKRG